MWETERKKYTRLNELAEQGGIVIFGGTEDKNIPVCELCQAFSMESKVYNRSFHDISIKNAIAIYDEIIVPLAPETMLLHIGEADRDFFAANPSAFDHKYRELISHIKKENKECRLCVVSLKNPDSDPQIKEMNNHLRNIADSERCSFGDIASHKVWNPKATANVASFVYSLGILPSLKNKPPVYDLVKIMFGYDL